MRADRAAAHRMVGMDKVNEQEVKRVRYLIQQAQEMLNWSNNMTYEKQDADTLTKTYLDEAMIPIREARSIIVDGDVSESEQRLLDGNR